MRQSLMRSFEQIYVLDLHGNAKKKERAPDGSKDENVFDIKQGVAISLFVKREGLERGIWRGDIWGKRLTKYELLADLHYRIDWSPIVPRAPQYLFSFLAEDAAYDSFLSVQDIFATSSVGIVTGRDDVAIQLSAKEMMQVVRTLSQGEKAVSSSDVKTGKDSTEWVLRDVIADIQKLDISEDNIRPLTYRPFDTRYTYRTGVSRGLINRPRIETWRNFDVPNLGLATSRLTKGEVFAHVLITDLMIEKILLSSKTSRACVQLGDSQISN